MISIRHSIPVLALLVSFPSTAATEVIRSTYAPGEITALCEKAEKDLLSEVAAIRALRGPQRMVFSRSIGRFENALAELGDATNPLVFMGYVSMDEKLREEGAACEERIGQLQPGLFLDKELYGALKVSRARTEAGKRLRQELLRAFEKNGMNLSDEKLAELKKLKQELASLTTRFSANLNNDKSSVAFTAAELEGVSESFLARLARTADSRYVVTTKSTDYGQVMENAKNPKTREKLLVAYLTRGGEENTRLMEEAVLVRQKIAKLLGYATWADVQLDGRMAKDSKTVLEFVNGLKEKLAVRNRADLDLLLKFKRESDSAAARVESFDVAYLSNQLKKRDYSLDDDAIREYFPFETVMKGLFEIYSTLLGVTYEEVTDVRTWSPDVKLYRVLEGKTKKLISYFYMDLVPRDGKYGHAAAFPLIAGRKLANGRYSVPVASVVANFEPPTANKPSLLGHDEVETLFHEFGHIMQQILTRVPYASLSGTNVAQDYVEAPSQMLENWVWDAEVLKRISGHYRDSSRKLPQELLSKMLAAKDFNLGYATTRQLLFGIFDMTIHMKDGPVDVTAEFNRLQSEIQGIDAVEGTRFPGTFGHLMGGYDAGYYGYLWSEVYAADMFSRFEKEGLLNPKTGARYRRYILESGNARDAEALISAFLGRKPSSDAFYRRLGLE